MKYYDDVEALINEQTGELESWIEEKEIEWIEELNDKYKWFQDALE